MPRGITQCNLPPGRGDIPTTTPAEAGTRLSDPGTEVCPTNSADRNSLQFTINNIMYKKYLVLCGNIEIVKYVYTLA